MSNLYVEDMRVIRDGNVIVDKVSLTIAEHEILGLIGPNGAGKSTTISGILGMAPVQHATIRFGDWTLHNGQEAPAQMKQRIAYIPEQPLYYSDLTVAEHFEWKRRLWGYASGRESGIALTERMEHLIHQFQLEPHLKKFPHQCSKGTLQKMMIVSAFLFPFDVLMIDEPFIGLDVLAIRTLRSLIEKARLDGAGILVSTHVLDSAERMCNRFVFMADGQVFARGTLEELRDEYPDFTRDGDGESTALTLEELFISLLERREVRE